MYILPERRRRIQTDDSRRLGSFVMCNMDSGDQSSERGVHGAYYRL